MMQEKRSTGILHHPLNTTHKFINVYTNGTYEPLLSLLLLHPPLIILHT